jgi:hypothetical protein
MSLPRARTALAALLGVFAVGAGLSANIPSGNLLREPGDPLDGL